jgi:hypothetical protein
MAEGAPIMAIDTWPTNGHLIADVQKLGYINKLDSVLDCTYGYGVFWSVWKPQSYLFHRTDIDPAKSPDDPAGVDFRKMPHKDQSFNVVVYDPPYGMRGTSALESDEQYGIHVNMRWQDRWDLIFDGLVECCRVAKERVLVKIQASVVSGKVRWQDLEAVRVAECHGFGLRDRFDFLSYREQPAGTSQKHARRNASTLLVLERGWEWRP